MMKRYSIIIPSFNNKLLTEQCLSSIRKNTGGMTYEIIVVDNASTDGAAEMLSKEKGITLILNKKNRNFAGACNQGADAATGEVLVFLNNDTEVQPGWLTAIDKAIQDDPKIGAVGVKLLFPDGKVQHAGVVISPDKTPRHIYYQAESSYQGVNKKREYHAVTAACIAIPKNVFLKAGRFDEKFINGLEDIDLCFKIKKLGYKIVYTPDSVVTHYESVAPGRFLKNEHNADLYMSRWKNARSDEHDYYREDGFGWWWIMAKDLAQMSWGPDKYRTRPLWIKILKWVYLPSAKLVNLFKLVVKGDFRIIKGKILRNKNV